LDSLTFLLSYSLALFYSLTVEGGQRYVAVAIQSHLAHAQRLFYSRTLSYRKGGQRYVAVAILTLLLSYSV